MDNYLFIPRAIVGGLHDLTFATAVGILFCRRWLRSRSTTAIDRRLDLSLITCAFLLLVTLLAQLILTTAVMSGSLYDVSAQMKDVLASTHAGRLLIVSLVFATAFGCSSLTSRYSSAPGLILLFALAMSRAATGHAASQGDFTLTEAVQLLHLTSSAVWGGCIMATSLFVVPQLHRQNNPSKFQEITRSLSLAATIAVLLVISSGIYNAWFGLEGSLHPLIHSQWGILLSIKSALVTAAVLLGFYNRILLSRKPKPFLLFTRTLQLEAVFIAAVLVLSAFLANSPQATS